MTKTSEFRKPFHAVCAAFIICMVVLGFYLSGPLQGEFNQFFLPAKMFGVPAELKAHGITELYKDKENSGWDGQFYYYISNDLFIKKDTLQHIDTPAYRYQRIGFPFLAKIMSKLTFQTWVSPFIYYLTSLLVLLAATGCAAFFFQKKGLNPYWILLWVFGLGSQVTLLNGLPDVVADGFLILGLIAVLDVKKLFYILAMSFAALSREVYVVFPAMMMLAAVLFLIKSQGFFSLFSIENTKALLKKWLPHIIPVAIWIAWQVWLHIKLSEFPFSAASGANNVLNWPLQSALHYLISGLSGDHDFVGKGVAAYQQGWGILLYLGLLGLGLNSARLLLKSAFSIKNFSERETLYFGFGISLILIISIYFCFSSLVMKYHTGYFKAANIFLFIVPFVFVLTKQKFSNVVKIFLLIVVSFFGYLLWLTISGGPLASFATVEYVSKEPPCLRYYNSTVKLLSIESLPMNFIKRIFSAPSFIVYVEITNTSAENFSPYPGRGAVDMSYQWSNKLNHSLAKDGIRTQLPHVLKPREKIVLPVVMKIPSKSGEYILNFSLVQEGCSWFYLDNPSSAFSLPYTIK